MPFVEVKKLERLRRLIQVINFQFRLFFSRIFGQGKIKTVGKTYRNRCDSSVKFLSRKNSTIIIKRIEARKNCIFATHEGAVIEFGNGNFFNCNCVVAALESIKIGNMCSFGPNVCIYDHDHAFGRAREKNGEGFVTAPVEIGNNCWVGANTVILRGTKIGDGCVIGAGCVVKGDIPANSLVTSGRELVIRPIE